MQKKKKRIFAVLLSAILVVALTGCSKLGSIINEIHGSLIGNNYTVYTYDNYGNQTLKTSGKKISITGNKIETVSYDSDGRAVTGYDLSSVITITRNRKLRRYLCICAEWAGTGGGFFIRRGQQ